jgi:drug/metabolite transporter (DMT)-like permease
MEPLKGISLKICSVSLITLMFALVKLLSDNFSAGQIVFFRSAFSIPVLFLWISLTGDLRDSLKVQSKIAHVWRGFIGTCAMALNFLALGFLPLPEITAIGFATPLFISIFAIFLLGERIGIYRFCALIVGLVGVLIIVNSKLTVFSSDTIDNSIIAGMILTIAAVICASLAHVQIRKMVQTERTSAIIFYFSVTSSLFSLISLSTWVLPSFGEFFTLILVGIIGGIAQIMLTTAYRLAPASLVAPFDYTAMIFALLIGYFVFEELPTSQMIFGTFVVMLAGIFVVIREIKSGQGVSKEKTVKFPPA